MTPASRYTKQTIIYYGEQNRLAFNIYNRKPYTPKGDEKVMLITKGVEYRPDLVSQDFYGFPDNWWKIMEANNMFDIMDFKAGVTLLLPGLSL